MVTETDDSRLGRLEGRVDEISRQLYGISQRLDAVNSRIDRLTLAILGIGGGVIVAMLSLVGVLATRLLQLQTG